MLPTLEPVEIEEDANWAPSSGNGSIGLHQLSVKDRKNFFFLCLLYYLQGVPVGLAFGSIPFLLKEKLSYSELGMFSFATYPYSLKLLWSPIVDGCFWPEYGRRRSWIVPVQFVSSLLLIWFSFRIRALLEDAQTYLPVITAIFFMLVLASATQDIAVDGWALTLLSKPALPYASTAQTIGLNSGYFSSFTVFLALSSPDFANRYLRKVPRDEGVLSLENYLFLVGIVYFFVTVFVSLFKSEERGRTLESGPERSSWRQVVSIYGRMLGIFKLPALRSLMCVHLVAKIAFQAADSVTNLKLLEKGLSKEDLALIVLIDFPFEIVFGYYTAKWATRVSPLQPWLWGYAGRIVYCFISMSQVYFFPEAGTTKPYLFYVMVVHVLGSFLSTVQFVAICAFHTIIADPEFGGTYMTVVNTVSNFGGTWPRFLVLMSVDYFTSATCSTGGSCSTQQLKDLCKKWGGTCDVQRDGYYVVNLICLVLGLVMFFGFIRRTMLRLQFLPTSDWRL